MKKPRLFAYASVVSVAIIVAASELDPSTSLGWEGQAAKQRLRQMEPGVLSTAVRLTSAKTATWAADIVLLYRL